MGRPKGKTLYPATTGLRIDAATFAALHRIAEAEDRSVAGVLRMLVREALAMREARTKDHPAH